MSERFPGSPQAEPIITNAGSQRARAMQKLREADQALRQSDPNYNAHVTAWEASVRTSEQKRAEQAAETAALLESLPGDASYYDDRFGKGTALALAKGEISWKELTSEPRFIHASTGDSMSLGEVSAVLSPERASAEHNLAPQVGHIAEDMHRIEDMPAVEVRTGIAETVSGPRIIEVVDIDPDHTVETVFDESGTLNDVIIIASETDAGGYISQHSVEIPLDQTPEGIVESTPKIDGEPISEDEFETVAAIVEHTVNEMDSLVSANSTAEKIQAGPAVTTSLERQKPEKTVPAIGHFIGGTARYLKGGVPDRILNQVAQEVGVSIPALFDKLSSGAILFDDASRNALRELQQNGLKPGSQEWNVDPNTRSALGGVSKESRQLLANLLQQLSR